MEKIVIALNQKMIIRVYKQSYVGVSPSDISYVALIALQTINRCVVSRNRKATTPQSNLGGYGVSRFGLIINQMYKLNTIIAHNTIRKVHEQYKL